MSENLAHNIEQFDSYGSPDYSSLDMVAKSGKMAVFGASEQLRGQLEGDEGVHVVSSRIWSTEGDIFTEMDSSKEPINKPQDQVAKSLIGLNTHQS